MFAVVRSATNAENIRTKAHKNKSAAKVTPRHCTHQKSVQLVHKYLLFLPVCLHVKECVCFYCHLTLFVRNKLIHRGFKSVRWFQSILHTPAYILHTLPRCRAVGFVVCGGLYGIGEQKNLSEQQTFLPPYAVMSTSRACIVWQRVGCVGCV